MPDTHLTRNLAFGLTALLTIALVTATAVERMAGSEVAFTTIYHSPWMIALWGVASACCLSYLILRRRGMSAPTILIHASLLLILTGAAVTHIWGVEGKLTLEQGVTANCFTLAEGGKAPLPYPTTLDRAAVEYYPGTSTPIDYASQLTVTIDGKSTPKRVSMNKILHIQGYRFYQTGIGEGTSTLSISRDPWGIGITYGGYILLALSMAAFFFSRKSRFHMLLRKSAATLPMLLLPAVFLGASPAAMGRTPGETPPPTIPRPLADRLGRVNVYWGDRVMPLNTMARDFCLKVHGSTSYRGLTPEQVMAGWLFYYDEWKKEPFIKVSGDLARRLTGIGDASHASLRDFYSPDGYKLSRAVADDLSDRALHDTDIRVSLVTMGCTGGAFKVFPIPPADGGDGPVEWLSLADRPPLTASEEDYIFISTILDRLSREIATRQWKNADDEITRLREFQERAAPPSTLPGDTRVKMEILYNRFGSPLLPALLSLVAGVAGFLPMRRPRLLYPLAAIILLVWTSGILIIRWYVGGHLPLSNGYETMLLLGWLSLAVATGFVTRGTDKTAGYAALTAAGLSLMVAVMGRAGATVSPLMPVLASPLLSLHVLLIMGAYSLAAITAILSAAWLLTPTRRRTPDTPRLCALMLYPLVFLMAAGIFVGAVWANQSWGRYWGWDPKETWALVTLLVYALPIHAASFQAFRRPRHLCLYLLLAFLSVLMTYFGVNHLLTGLHSYA